MKTLGITIFLLCILSCPLFAQDKKPERMKGVQLSEPQKKMPTIVIGANELAEHIVERGWPLIISIAVLSEDQEPLDVPNNLKLILRNEKDEAVAVKFDPVSTDNKETRFWIVAEEETKTLTPGNYMVTLEPVEGMTIQPAELEVVLPNPEHEEAFNNLNIQKLLLRGQTDDALAEADRQIAKNGENINALLAKGDILMDQDLPDEAIKVYTKALALAEKEDTEPLFIIERHRAALFRSLEKRGVIQKTNNQP
jgi:tetratricopeptide (TPR) repeat protein